MIRIGGNQERRAVTQQGSSEITTTITLPGSPSPAIQKVAQWWLDTAADDFVASVPKTAEYGGTQQGSADLRLMGDNLAELMGWKDISDAIKQELAVWFYVQGKAARLVSNYQQQQPGKADTWLDITVYSMMARRLQETGLWP